MLWEIPARSSTVFVAPVAECSLAPRCHIAILAHVGPTDTVCGTVSRVRSTSHLYSLSTRVTSCRELPGGCLPRHVQHLYPQPQALPLAARVGAARIECCTAVQWQMSRVPLPSPAVGALLPEPVGRIASWQENWEEVWVAGLANLSMPLALRRCH